MQIETLEKFAGQIVQIRQYLQETHGDLYRYRKEHSDTIREAASLEAGIIKEIEKWRHTRCKCGHLNMRHADSPAGKVCMQDLCECVL